MTTTRRALLRRLDRLRQGGAGWTSTTEEYVDEETGEPFLRHTATSPHGVAACIEAPVPSPTMEHWLEHWGEPCAARTAARLLGIGNGADAPPTNGHAGNGNGHAAPFTTRN